MLKCKKIKEDLKEYVKKYDELYQYICVDNASSTKGCEYFVEMDFIIKKITFLNNLLPYVKM